jgi:hypothetical protein
MPEGFNGCTKHKQNGSRRETAAFYQLSGHVVGAAGVLVRAAAAQF